MGIGSMVQFTTRVAVFAAVAAFLLQVSCTIGPLSPANLEMAAPAGSGCHEPTPATPDAPDSGHTCCDGNHSPDALLSAAIAPTPPTLAEALLNPVFYATAPFNRPPEIAPASFGPPGPFILRI